MLIIASSFQFFEISQSSDDEKRMGGEEEGQDAGAEGGVEVDEKW